MRRFKRDNIMKIQLDFILKLILQIQPNDYLCVSNTYNAKKVNPQSLFKALIHRGDIFKTQKKKSRTNPRKAFSRKSHLKLNQENCSMKISFSFAYMCCHSNCCVYFCRVFRILHFIISCECFMRDFSWKNYLTLCRLYIQRKCVVFS